mmetsp:Transcript_158000/g.278960  ORF Transcript_158000/g.278960 Transcript_158000/m.278960 type:complete len:252 (-) Transcript_158000:56-811(-)
METTKTKSGRGATSSIAAEAAVSRMNYKPPKLSVRDFNLSGKWVMTDSKSGDRFKYYWTQTTHGTFTGEQRGAGKLTRGEIEGDLVTWEVANIRCTGVLASASKLVEGEYFDKKTGKRLGTFTGECQDQASSKPSLNETAQASQPRMAAPAPAAPPAAPDDDIDPLDAFMAGMSGELQEDLRNTGTGLKRKYGEASGLPGAGKTDSFDSHAFKWAETKGGKSHELKQAYLKKRHAMMREQDLKNPQRDYGD